jgi:hypothetical protein
MLRQKKGKTNFVRAENVKIEMLAVDKSTKGKWASGGG